MSDRPFLAQAAEMDVGGLGDFAVWMSLASFAGPDGAASPGLPDIVQRCGGSDRAVRNILDRLEFNGFITRQTGLGRGNPTIYKLIIKVAVKTRFTVPPLERKLAASASFSGVKVAPAASFSRVPSTSGDLGTLPLTDPVRTGSVRTESTKTVLVVSEPADQPKKSEFRTAELMKVWNETAQNQGWSTIRKFTDSRRQAARLRLLTYDKTEVLEAIEKAVASSFCNGTNDRGWLATFDWFVRPNTIAKLLEGAHDDRRSGGVTAAIKPPRGKYDEFD